MHPSAHKLAKLAAGNVARAVDVHRYPRRHERVAVKPQPLELEVVTEQLDKLVKRDLPRAVAVDRLEEPEPRCRRRLPKHGAALVARRQQLPVARLCERHHLLGARDGRLLELLLEVFRRLVEFFFSKLLLHLLRLEVLSELLMGRTSFNGLSPHFHKFVPHDLKLSSHRFTLFFILVPCCG